MANVKRPDAKEQIQDILMKTGYPTYAKLLGLYDIYLTDDPNVVGYTVPGAGTIVLNKDLDTDSVSTIVRHEILHEYLSHGLRIDRYNKEHSRTADEFSHQAANMAADYDISNRGYTQKDKANARRIKVGDRIITGLVTEDDHPDWTKKSMEEMYDELLKSSDEMKEQIKQMLKDAGLPSEEEIKKMIDQILDDIEEEQKKQKQQGQQKGNQQQKSGSQGGGIPMPMPGNPSGQGSGQPQQGQDTEQGNGEGQGDKESQKSSGKGQSGQEQDGEGDNLDKMKDAAKRAKQKADEIKKDEQQNGPIDTPERQEAKRELARRIQRIADAVEKASKDKDLETEANISKVKEVQAKQLAKETRHSTSALSQFRSSLNKMIANQIEDEEEETYARENPAYADEDEFILPGKLVRDVKKIPIINVYWDVSGSFMDPAKTKAAREAIATLQKFEKAGEIETHTYYFADTVSDTRTGAGMGTSAYPVVQHIIQTEPDNVIIITDSDTSDQPLPSVTVPGAVWMLFYGGRSNALMNNVRGKKDNKYYDISW